MAASTTGLDLGLLVLRLGAGGFLLPHALGKLFGWFNGPGLSGFADELRGFGLPAPAPAPLLLAVLQVLCGVAVLLGWQTRMAASVAALFLATTAVLALPKGWFWMRGVQAIADQGTWAALRSQGLQRQGAGPGQGDGAQRQRPEHRVFNAAAHPEPALGQGQHGGGGQEQRRDRGRHAGLPTQ